MPVSRLGGLLLGVGMGMVLVLAERGVELRSVVGASLFAAAWLIWAVGAVLLIRELPSLRRRFRGDR